MIGYSMRFFFGKDRVCREQSFESNSYVNEEVLNLPAVNRDLKKEFDMHNKPKHLSIEEKNLQNYTWLWWLSRYE